MTTMVYVDNDNIQFTKYEDIITSFFNTSFYKIFINEYELSKIDESIKNKHKFIVCNNNGKNSLDISLTIECMKDLVRNTNIHTYVIVSNDTDFIPLCKELKEYGKSCILFTDRIPNESTIDVYDKIVNIGDHKKEEEKREHLTRELEKQKVLEEKRRIENLKVQHKKKDKKKDKQVQGIMINCDMKIKVKSLLDEYFTIDPTLKLSYDKMILLLKDNNIDYTKEYKKLGIFLKKYLPNDYKIVTGDGCSFILKGIKIDSK
jgi:uncharacterized protein (TIGR00288 family)